MIEAGTSPDDNNEDLYRRYTKRRPWYRRLNKEGATETGEARGN